MDHVQRSLDGVHTAVFWVRHRALRKPRFILEGFIKRWSPTRTMDDLQAKQTRKLKHDTLQANNPVGS